MSRAPLPPDDPASLFQLVIDNIPQFIFWKDRKSVYLGCNRNFACAAGVEHPEDIVGKTDFDLAWKREEAEFFRMVDDRVMSTGEPERDILEPQLQADGKQAWISTNKIPLRDDHGSVVGILGTFEDVTERKLAEERLRQSQKLETVGQLAGGIAHDFNNLLGGITGAVEVLQRVAAPEPRVQELLDLVGRTALRGGELTSKLLAFSRERSRHLEHLDLHRGIRDAAAILERSIDKRIDLHLELEAERSIVDGDASELESCILNLGLNARDAMPSGGTLRIRTCNEMRGGDPCIRVSVEDTGVGIPPEVQERIFDPFFTTKPVGKGTGLGLAVVYGVVRDHEGDVTLESSPGAGTRLHLHLPIAEASEASLASSDEPAADGHGLILLVDDEESIRVSVSLLLEDLGYEVLVARDGAECLERARAHPGEIRAVILDVIMPRLDGRDCLRQLRAIQPTVPVLLTSGFAFDSVVTELHSLGVGAFLRKPYRRAELARALARLLEPR